MTLTVVMLSASLSGIASLIGTMVNVTADNVGTIYVAMAVDFTGFICMRKVWMFQQNLMEKQLEGVVAKRSDSLYYQGKRTKDWIKFKRMADREFISCGYEAGKVISLILGEYKEGEMSYAGTVTWGVRREILEVLTKGSCPFPQAIALDKNVVWCKPKKNCTVEYMPNTLDALRQPVFKGIRDDV